MPDQYACQFSGTRPCPMAAAFRLHFRTAAGLGWTELACRSHCDTRKDQVRADGGTLIRVDDLAPPPAPIAPAPVGLDAIDPTTSAPPSKPFRPDWAVHPGEILAGEIAERGWTIPKAAAELRWGNGLLRTVLDGIQDVKEGMAADLARVFGLTAGAWLRLQERYTARLAEQRAAERTT